MTELITRVKMISFWKCSNKGNYVKKAPTKNARRAHTNLIIKGKKNNVNENV